MSRVVPDVGHVVAAQYAQSDWWQVSYSSGRVATMWRDYAMLDERGFLERVRSLAEKLVGGGSPVSEVRRHLWPFAFHKWRAVPNFDLARAVATCVRVNPVRLPRVLCAGEAFSSHQGWMEGALETAELAVAAVTARDGVTPRPDVVPDRTFAPREWTVYVEGLRLDVRAFADVHPGGIAALREHVGEHLDDYMLQFDHSPHAWAVVRSLKPWCYAADAAACGAAMTDEVGRVLGWHLVVRGEVEETAGRAVSRPSGGGSAKSTWAPPSRRATTDGRLPRGRQVGSRRTRSDPSDTADRRAGDADAAGTSCRWRASRGARPEQCVSDSRSTPDTRGSPRPLSCARRAPGEGGEKGAREGGTLSTRVDGFFFRVRTSHEFLVPKLGPARQSV